MANKGNKRHTKRYNAPGFIQIKRKHNKFFLNTKPGPHKKRVSLPLAHVLRDVIEFAHTLKEARYILNNRKVLVDGRVIIDPRFPVGLMDVLEIPEINKRYRILPSKRHHLTLSEITEEEAKFKLCKIQNISTQKGGALQLNMHDGRNIVIDVDDPTKSPDNKYKTNGTVKISIPDQEILEYYSFEEGNEAIVYEGTNIAHAGKLSKITKRYGVRASIVEIGDVSTAFEYVFIIGENKPSIDLPLEEN